MLLKAALGQAAVSKHWDGAAQGRAHSSHSPEKEPDIHVFMQGIGPGTGMEPVVCVHCDGSVVESWQSSQPREDG